MMLFDIDPKNSRIVRTESMALAALCIYSGLPLLRADRSVNNGGYVYVLEQNTETEVQEIAKDLVDDLCVYALPFLKAMQELLSAQKKRQHMERRYN